MKENLKDFLKAIVVVFTILAVRYLFRIQQEGWITNYYWCQPKLIIWWEIYIILLFKNTKITEN